MQIHEIIPVPILFVLKINWIFPLMSFKLFVCVDICTQYCETTVKVTCIKQVDKFHSEQLFSKMTTRYSTHQPACPLQHGTNNVPLRTDLSAAPHTHHMFRRGARRVKLYVGIRQTIRGGRQNSPWGNKWLTDGQNPGVHRM